MLPVSWRWVLSLNQNTLQTVHYRYFVALGACIASALSFPLAVASEADGNAVPSPVALATKGKQVQTDAEEPILPGQCWIQGQIKPRPVTQTLEVVLKDSHTLIQVTPAEIRRGYKQVVTRDGTITYRIEPPTYKEVLDKVLVRPEVKRYVVVPAVYETRQKEVVVEEAKTVMDRCRAGGTRYAKTDAIAYCVRELPAKQETVTVQELVQPEGLQEEIEPAQYQYVVRRVVDKPARVVQVTLSPEMVDIPVEEVAVPSQTHQMEVPAQTKDLQVTSYEGEPRLVMRKALCDYEMTPPLIASLQEQLLQRGYHTGAVDGLLGKNTLEALSDYQVDHGLAVGAMTYESLQHLGIPGF